MDFDKRKNDILKKYWNEFGASLKKAVIRAVQNAVFATVFVAGLATLVVIPAKIIYRWSQFLWNLIP